MLLSLDFVSARPGWLIERDSEALVPDALTSAFLPELSAGGLAEEVLFLSEEVLVSLLTAVLFSERLEVELVAFSELRPALADE